MVFFFTSMHVVCICGSLAPINIDMNGVKDLHVVLYSALQDSCPLERVNS